MTLLFKALVVAVLAASTIGGAPAHRASPHPTVRAAEPDPAPLTTCAPDGFVAGDTRDATLYQGKTLVFQNRRASWATLVIGLSADRTSTIRLAPVSTAPDLVSFLVPRGTTLLYTEGSSPGIALYVCG